MKARDIALLIEHYAPLSYQEEWDNCGVQVGRLDTTEVTGVLLCTDVTPAVIAEAVRRGMNMIISHHPLIFHGLKKIAGRTLVEDMVEQAIKHDLVIYSAHTNMDNTPLGVSWHMAHKLGMTQIEVLDPHPMPEPATTSQASPSMGCGVVGNVEPTPMSEWLKKLKATFEVGAVRVAGDTSGTVRRVALCGGAGGFLIDKAIKARADVYVTADLRYHDFLENNHRIVLADIGHYESEHYTKELFYDIIQEKSPNFAVAFATDENNQINYL